jgi:hypothetical protein
MSQLVPRPPQHLTKAAAAGATAIAVTYFVIYALGRWEDFVYSPPLERVRLGIELALYAVTAAWTVGLLYAVRRRTRDTQEEEIQQQQKVEAALATANQAVEFPEFFSAQVAVLAERMRGVLKAAEHRAQRLYLVGSMLAIASALAPVLTLATFVAVHPIDTSTVAALEELRATYGEYPPGLEVSAQRDWRVLLSGVSFGFLLLAAAGAIFSQHRRQVEMYQLASAEVDYYDRLTVATKLATRADVSEVPDITAKLLEAVTTRLLERPEVRLLTSRPQKAPSATNATSAGDALLASIEDFLRARLGIASKGD